MVTGIVDEDGQALVPLSMRRTRDSEPTQLQVWVDTAFTGDLALSESLIRQLGLRKATGTWAVYADGTTKRVDAFTGFIEWFGETRKIEVVAGNNATPLLGVCLLLGHRLEVDYHALTVTIDQPS